MIVAGNDLDADLRVLHRSISNVQSRPQLIQLEHGIHARIRVSDDGAGLCEVATDHKLAAADRNCRLPRHLKRQPLDRLVIPYRNGSLPFHDLCSESLSGRREQHASKKK